MNYTKILKKLPYSKPFLFVDELSKIDENGITGNYTFPENSFFYKGHFKDFPITPGVILTECMAQIGLVSLGIYLLNLDNQNTKTPQVAFTSSEMDYFLPVFPGEKVTVVSTKIYFRFNKLKCDIQMMNKDGKLVCKGTLAGMFKNENR